MSLSKLENIRVSRSWHDTCSQVCEERSVRDVSIALAACHPDEGKVGRISLLEVDQHCHQLQPRHPATIGPPFSFGCDVHEITRAVRQRRHLRHQSY